MSGSAPTLSDNPYDWLGRGFYFWEYGPSRAAEWALQRFPGHAAMLEARINLGYCLNLLDSEHFDSIVKAYGGLKEDQTGSEVLGMKNKHHHPTPIETRERVLRQIRELSREEIEQAIDDEGRRLQEAAERVYAKRREELAQR